MTAKFFGKRVIGSLAAATLLVACGGGGSDDDDDDPVVGGNIDATLQGAAAKGIVIAGLITAFELNADGDDIRQVGEAVTGADGAYQLALGDDYDGGPIRVEVSKGPDTRMICDATSGCGTRTDGLGSGDDSANNDDGNIDFGEQYVPSSLSMNALIPDAEDGETIAAQVTPFTSVAAARALAGGTLSAASIAAANSEVSALLGGVDILRTPPVDITRLSGDEDAITVAYAGLNAAILELADDDANGQPDIDAVIGNLRGAFSNGMFDAGDMQDIIDAAAGALGQGGAVDISGVLLGLQADVDDAIANNGGVLDPQPNPNAGDSDVLLAKALISDLRTWGTVIGDELDTPASAFDEQVDMAQFVLDLQDDATVLDAVSPALDAILDHVTENLVGNDLTGYTSGGNEFRSGSISSVETADGLVYTISNAEVWIFGFAPVSVDMEALVTPEGPTTEIVLDIRSLTTEDFFVRLEANAGNMTVGLSESFDLDYASEGVDPAIDSLELDLDVTMTWMRVLDDFLQPVELTDPVSFTGGIALTAYPLQDGNNAIVDLMPGTMTANGTIANTTGDSLALNLSLSIPNAASLQPLSSFANLDSTYAENNAGNRVIEWVFSGDTFTYTSPEGVFTATLNGSQVDYMFPWGGPFTEIGPFNSIQEFVTTRPWLFESFVGEVSVDGQGEYERETYSFDQDFATDGFEVFRLVDANVEWFDETQPAIGQVGLQFSAQFDGLPEAQISLTGNTTAFEAGNADLSISYGDRRLAFDASNDTPDGEIASVVVTNLDGVELTLAFDNLEDVATGQMTINGKAVADLSELDNGMVKVSYIDGTFEIF